MAKCRPKSEPIRFYSGLQMIRHYIPDYGKDQEVLTVEEEAKRTAARIMSKIKFTLEQPFGSEPTITATVEKDNPSSSKIESAINESSNR
ncbi:MAG: hypothetical protein OXO49_03160 [Gammaproteobacteria bacterium]|nr:hypothetical protein [Gammaproteobacteria bacterium]MDE0251978.1 hypothetical protein [Gammaproteobacteria bacterium]MDE0402914.1 hypothetical protein [Gammaproteobacteria bacterium]